MRSTAFVPKDVGSFGLGPALLQDVGQLQLYLALELGSRLGGQRLPEEPFGLGSVARALRRHAAPIRGLDSLRSVGEAREEFAE